jgi:hypothetical protein
METIMPARHEDTGTSHTSHSDDTGETRPRLRPQTWRERHALKLLGAVMVAMFATVIIAQVAC